ncbi:MAG: hypothetical protein M0R46_18000 [Candidatus Muirbacterium halophilum]|nr:hypothetical protein [Candidatus Muirbacterium halophilum]MCK9477811.1 hypothetical protein [Candidatus Muirbacterium halophilum]
MKKILFIIILNMFFSLIFSEVVKPDWEEVFVKLKALGIKEKPLNIKFSKREMLLSTRSYINKYWIYYENDKNMIISFYDSGKIDSIFLNFGKKIGKGKKLSESEMLKAGRKIINTIRPDINNHDYFLKKFGKYENEDTHFIFYNKMKNGYVVKSDCIYVEFHKNGLFDTFFIFEFNSDFPVNIKVTKKEAEEIAIRYFKGGNFGSVSEEVLEILKLMNPEKIKKLRKRYTELNLNFSKPIVVVPNYYHFTKPNSILTKEYDPKIKNMTYDDMLDYVKDEKYITYNDEKYGTGELRLVWIIVVDFGRYFNYRSRCPFSAVYVDCETGEIIGGF